MVASGRRLELQVVVVLVVIGLELPLFELVVLFGLELSLHVVVLLVDVGLELPLHVLVHVVLLVRVDVPLDVLLDFVFKLVEQRRRHVV